MLQTRDLTCERNGRLLFENLSFSVAPGEVLRIEGANGTGKTTLLRLLCGLYQDYTGVIEWDLDDYPLFIGHKPGVKDLLTASENLRWLGSLYTEDLGSDQIDAALERVGLRGFEHSPCGALSEGQRKRVNLARLYLLDSPAWVLDEPLSAIDVKGVADLQGRMSEHLTGGGMILLTSHQALDVEGTVKTIRLGAA